MPDTALHWFRRDLRLDDNTALDAALSASAGVYCVFVFDTDILDALDRREDRRVDFILRSVAELAAGIAERGGRLIVLHGRAVEEVPRLARRLEVSGVFVNRDYEPAAIARDRQVEQALMNDGIAFVRCKDQVVFEQDELMSGQGRPLTVFSAYRNAWLRKLPEVNLGPAPAGRGCLVPPPPAMPEQPLPSLQSLGFEATDLLSLGVMPGASGAQRTLQAFQPRMSRYHEARDYPAVRGTSCLSVHLRFGTLSIRRLVDLALRENNAGSRAWLDELVWRDFHFSILYLFPRVVGHAFRREMDRLVFRDRDDQFEAWCQGRTGYPFVDAGMRQLNRTGYMHNRLRMVTASFLVKDLQVDWRRGERYFAAQLIDYDLAANNGGWQWSASTGNDAQPWFRIFNPVLQSKRFDSSGDFIRRHVPELAGCDHQQVHEPWKMNLAEQEAAGVIIGRDYPAPIVDHAAARREALRMFEQARAAAGP